MRATQLRLAVAALQQRRLLGRRPSSDFCCIRFERVRRRRRATHLARASSRRARVRQHPLLDLAAEAAHGDGLAPADRRRILDIGCGFGLFAAYFGQTNRGRAITGVDPDGRRIEMATRVAKNLGLDKHRFVQGDARELEPGKVFDAIYVLDVMHHIPEQDQLSVLQSLEQKLAPGGILILKDITTTPYLGLKFTEYLDRVMVGWDEPLAYRHHDEWKELLSQLGFKVRVVLIPDILPYPHVVLAARKAG